MRGLILRLLTGARALMRVALVNLTTTTKIGGVETFVRQLARFLAARDIDVTIFGGAPARVEEMPAVPGVTVRDRCPTSTARSSAACRCSRANTGRRNCSNALSFALHARAILESGDFDIIHIHKPFDFPLAAWLRARTRARVVYSSHGRDFFPGDKRFIGSIDVLTACSRYNAADVLARYGCEARVIYNGVDTDQFSPQTPDPARWQRQVVPGAPIVALGRTAGAVEGDGRCRPRRRVGPIACPPRIAGTGPEESRLRDAARSLGIADRVHFLGNVPHEELPALLAATQVALGTSFANETFGMTLAEASACARPVIATDFGGFPEVVRDGETGLLVPPRDPARLAAAIDAIIGDPAGAAQMGEAGRAFVTAAFAWPTVTERVIAAYEEALDAH